MYVTHFCCWHSGYFYFIFTRFLVLISNFNISIHKRIVLSINIHYIHQGKHWMFFLGSEMLYLEFYRRKYT